MLPRDSSEDVRYILEGRSFTLYELKKAIIAASGGKLSQVFLDIWDLYLWEILESLEILSEIAEERSSERSIESWVKP